MSSDQRPQDLNIAQTGKWLYGDTVFLPVDIIALDYDFWYEIGKADDQLEPDETPQQMGSDGYLYYVRFRRAGHLEAPTWVDSGGYVCIQDAMTYAESRVPTCIHWSGTASRG
ncbi:hypothetical protein GCM10027285_14400 [Oleiagrimonas citrea]|jgi:hypothetical protein|uniref:Uncharacterized protein n=1 Tax=Oleiagrimonas citrea TaxID=1665687 RepID=A0A846ZRK5_9GAMM|nr:hypothetical protein [Oleiagrimonas citrea]NKZ40063.1 hypothetical protein [Oleiagrimonas citrea]